MRSDRKPGGRPGEAAVPPRGNRRRSRSRPRGRFAAIGLLIAGLVLAACGSAASVDGEEPPPSVAETTDEPAPVVTIPDDILTGDPDAASGAAWAPVVVVVLLAIALFAILRNVETRRRG